MTEERKRIYYVDVVRGAMDELNIKTSVYNVARNTNDMLIAVMYE